MKNSDKTKEQLVVDIEKMSNKINELEKLETEQRKAEEMLRNNEAKHSAMIENIGDVIAIVGADGITKYQSPNVEKWFGWKPEDLIGKQGWDKMHQEDIERIQKEFAKMIENGNPLTVKYRFKCKDGVYKWIELTAVNRLNNPAINGVLLNYHDITERKLAEEELLKSKVLLESSIEGPKDMIILSLDKQYRYLYFNKAHADSMSQVYGNKPQIGNCIFDIMTYTDDIEIVKDHYNRALNGEGHTTIDEIGEGELRSFYEVKYNPIYSEKNELVGVSVFAQDITERKLAEEELNNHRDNLEEMVDERTKELEDKNNELDNALKVFVGRELTIKKLQERIKALEEK
jgi:PAS domain S-box-containing protein